MICGDLRQIRAAFKVTRNNGVYGVASSESPEVSHLSVCWSM